MREFTAFEPVPTKLVGVSGGEVDAPCSAKVCRQYKYQDTLIFQRRKFGIFKDPGCDGCEISYHVHGSNKNRIKHVAFGSDVKLNGKCVFAEKTGRAPVSGDVFVYVDTTYGGRNDLRPTILSPVDHTGDQDNVYSWKVQIQRE